MSRPRKEVIRALCKQERHITAESLWLDIYASHKISISAVYNNLNFLVMEGFAEKKKNPHGQFTFAMKKSPEEFAAYSTQ